MSMAVSIPPPGRGVVDATEDRSLYLRVETRPDLRATSAYSPPSCVPSYPVPPVASRQICAAVSSADSTGAGSFGSWAGTVVFFFSPGRSANRATVRVSWGSWVVDQRVRRVIPPPAPAVKKVWGAFWAVGVEGIASLSGAPVRRLVQSLVRRPGLGHLYVHHERFLLVQCPPRVRVRGVHLAAVPGDLRDRVRGRVQAVRCHGRVGRGQFSGVGAAVFRSSVRGPSSRTLPKGSRAVSRLDRAAHRVVERLPGVVRPSVEQPDRPVAGFDRHDGRVQRGALAVLGPCLLRWS
jgi:hypothetical protein